MSYTAPVQVGTLKKGSHVVIQGNPCKIDDYSVSKQGKHGSAKMHIIASDIFTGKRFETMASFLLIHLLLQRGNILYLILMKMVF